MRQQSAEAKKKIIYRSPLNSLEQWTKSTLPGNLYIAPK